MYAAKNYYQCVWQLLPCETYRDCTILMFSDTFRKNVFNIPDTYDVNINLLSIRKAGRRKWKMVQREGGSEMVKQKSGKEVKI